MAGTLRDEFVPQTIGWWTLAWVGFGIAVWRNERLGLPMWALWAGAITFRVMLLATEPTLSDDVYRYLWDGHVATSGINPYRYSVAASELDAVSIPIRELVNNPGLATPYLPATQLLFAAVAVVAPADALSMQIVMVLFDLGTGLLLVGLLTTLGLPAGRSLLYLWNPLVIVEVAHGAHLDAFMVMATIAAIATLRSPTGGRGGIRRVPRWGAGAGRQLAGAGWAWSPLLLAVATLTRIVPALLLAVLWWRWCGRQRLVFAVACTVPIGLFALGPGLGLATPLEGTGVFGSARVYAERWEFNSLVFNQLHRWLQAAGADDPGTAARQLLAVGLLAGLMVIWIVVGRRPRRAGPVDRTDLAMLFAVVGLYAALTTTLHPWYLILLLAFAPFIAPDDHDRSMVRSWLPVITVMYLAASSALSYLTYLDPLAHAEQAWVRQVEWYPTFALAGAGWLTWRRSRRADDGGSSRERDRPGEGGGFDLAASSRIDADGEVAAGSPVVPG